MNENINAVLLGVVSNVLTTFLLSPFGKAGKKKPSSQRIIREAVAEVGETVEWSGTPRVEEVCLFLASPEVESVVRQIYSSRLTQSKEVSVELVRQEFLALFESQFQATDAKTRRASSGLFDTILDSSDDALNAAIENEVLSAHEARSNARFRQLLDELAVVKKNLSVLKARRKPDIKSFIEFENKYRAQVEERHGRITPPNFDAARKLPINDIYVAPEFVRFSKTKREAPNVDAKAVSYPKFLSDVYRVVLLGNPGGGKSTLTDKICYDLSSGYSQRQLGGRQLTSVKVVLRDYGAEKKARNCSILQFIESTANSTYQVQAPKGCFDYLLLNGRVVILFDGLDELLDTAYRQKITADVESFCNLYPALPVLITSREIGYEQAPLNEKKFETYRLSDFNEEQVKSYVTKWFRADLDLTTSRQEQQADSFLKESLIVPDLRSNPLMLALMCNIYRGENYIPQNRPDLYEKCAVMLFERWDKQRGIIVPLPFEAHIRPAMMYLAHWIYTNAPLQSGVDERKLIRKTAEYLLEHRFEDQDEAEAAAREFIEFCKGRAWVFTDTGAGLFQFTHRTFLEYFTAFHLVRKYSTADQLKNVLIDRIAKREWDIVAQLSVQLQNEYSEGAGDAFLSMLLSEASKTANKGVAGWNLVSFAARCLQFLVPSPKVRKQIAEASVEWSTAHGIGWKELHGIRPDIHFSFVPPPIQELLQSTKENRSTVVKTVRMALTDRITKGSDADAALAIELTFGISFALKRSIRESDPENFQMWEDLVGQVFEECKMNFMNLSEKQVSICNIAFWLRRVTVEDFIRWHGAKRVFERSQYSIMPVSWSIASQLFSVILFGHSFSYGSEGPDGIPPHEYDSQQLRTLGQTLIATTPPWMEHLRSEIFVSHYLFDALVDEDTPREAPNWDNDVIFGGFALLATGLEASTRVPKHKLPVDLTRSLKNSKAPLLHFIRASLLARFEPIAEEEIQTELETCHFDSQQRALVLAWVRRDLDLVKRAPQRRRAARKTSKKR
jgi:hypothetical protein